jgi:lysozyme family protein
MTDLAALTARNAARWANAVLVRAPEFGPVAKRLCAAKARYQTISDATGVPWFAIAVIHEREASQRFDRQLGQGDPLNQVSTHDPAGRGPFFDHPNDPPGQDAFYRGALDALTDCEPYAARWRDWSAGGTMTLLEQYNGLGYAAKGLPSPYVWSGTDQYRSGKYVADHVFDPNVVDSQLGCAGLIKAMMAIDPTIAFTGATDATPKPIPPPPEIKLPPPGQPAPPTLAPTFWGRVLDLFKPKG